MTVQFASFLILGIIFIIVIFYSSGVSGVFAVSPTFNRQQIADTPNDWVAVNYTGTGIYSATASDCVSLQNRVSFPGINAASYISDGRNLTTTLWLSSPFKEPTNDHSLRYGMLIDVASIYDQGPDYLTDIQWNSSSNSWVRTEYELLSIAGERKVLYRNDTSTHFFEKGKKFVNLYLDLAHLNFPNQYQVQFFSQDNHTIGDGFCVFADSTNWVTNPPPEFEMTTLPSSVKLDTGDKKEIQLQLHSTSLVAPEVSLGADERRGITLEFNPPDPYLPPNSLGFSRVLVEGHPDAVMGEYVIPIVLNFSFPITNASARNENSTFPISNTTVASSKITQYYPIQVTIESPDLYTLVSRWFNSFWQTYGDFIGIVAGGFAGGFAGWVFTNKKIRKTRGTASSGSKIEPHPEK